MNVGERKPWERMVAEAVVGIVGTEEQARHVQAALPGRVVDVTATASRREVDTDMEWFPHGPVSDRWGR